MNGGTSVLVFILLVNAILSFFRQKYMKKSNMKSVILTIAGTGLIILQGYILNILYGGEISEDYENYKNYKNIHENFGVFDKPSSGIEWVKYIISVPLVYLFFHWFLKYLIYSGFPLYPYIKSQYHVNNKIDFGKILNSDGCSLVSKAFRDIQLKKQSQQPEEKNNNQNIDKNNNQNIDKNNNQNIDKNNFIKTFLINVVSFFSLICFCISSPLRLLLSGFKIDNSFIIPEGKNQYTKSNINNMKININGNKGNELYSLKNIKNKLNLKKKERIEKGVFLEQQVTNKLKETLDNVLNFIVESLSSSIDGHRLNFCNEEKNKNNKKLNAMNNFYKSQCKYFIYLFWIIILIPTIFNITDFTALSLISYIFILYPIVISNFGGDSPMIKKIKFIIMVVILGLFGILYPIIKKSMGINAKNIIDIFVLLVALCGMLYHTYYGIGDYYTVSLFRIGERQIKKNKNEITFQNTNRNYSMQ